MKNNKISAMALSEVRWPGCSVLEVENATVVYSDNEENNICSQRGTAIGSPVFPQNCLEKKICSLQLMKGNDS